MDLDVCPAELKAQMSTDAREALIAFFKINQNP